MITKFRISLKAARVNAGLTQNEVCTKLADIMGIPISKNRFISYEKHPEKVPRIYGEKLAEIYNIPIDYIFFGHDATKSLHHKNKHSKGGE